MTEEQAENSESERDEINRVLEKSRRTIERTKKFVSELDENIERQEKILAKQRENMNRLLDDLGIEKD